ncbi:nicotinamide-nucleotide amidase [Ulvibacter sp. MAR_2010_11]|uniref:competence/damage-inducible protein A n=1 Tax=Ulvibacter sp. MAR_2010_11 TaxID=1250229 RepID=UPI000C2C014D|nr:competence/damage-inducible protein A [Ulvibacter sp. MAR_2010_11]PKA83701.1 nicotinamide-nucleotide amidase [Ulvibacter sp. MAR_2010_11]
MLAEIITIGDEILIGQIVDTNSAFIAKELNKIGVQVYQITSIQDDKEHILQALKDAKQRVNLVLITGGLGPTKDDITKETLCEFFDDTLVESAEVLDNVNRLFSKYFNRKPLPSNLLQAKVPSKATVLNNTHGTAPGMWIEEDNVVFVSMPGVPYEMKYLMLNEVLPRVVKRYDRPFIYHKTLLTYGLGESAIADRIEDWENSLPKEIRLAYLPSLGRVRLRLSSKGKDEAQLHRAVDKQMDVLWKLLEDIAVGYEDETSIEERIGALLAQREQSLSLAESCTGGAIAKKITGNPGASAFFKGSIIPYQTIKKVDVLGVDEQLIHDHSVVSAPVAEAMAQHVKKLFETDYGVATTGIAGPTLGDSEDEVGTVFIAIAGPKRVISEKFSFGNARERVISKATNKAFEMLLKEILKN